MESLLKALPSADGRAGSDPTLGPVNALFDLAVRDTLPLGLRDALSSALTSSLGWVFVVVMLMAVVGAVLALRFPADVKRET
jgi:hypothetical protein